MWVLDPESKIRDPISEIWDPEKTYSGSMGQKRTGSQIPDLDPQHSLEDFVKKIHKKRINTETLFFIRI
jgi:hypothetical protein